MVKQGEKIRNQEEGALVLDPFFLWSRRFALSCVTAMPLLTHKAFLGLGSNLGNREQNLHLALHSLAHTGIQIAKVSSMYATEPVDFKNQDWFLNQVISAETSLEPADLLAHCFKVEQDLGRERTIPKGPRSIDVDILLYNRLVIEDAGLTIPHPRLHLRRFVLVPLAEIAPEFLHPIFKQPITNLLEKCADRSQVVMFKQIC
ncbi:MAG: 2-amino-4-hydroxy-6-hydroxymethyldihydropteridine diphosphokinase [Acidobacteria bacterium]|nr:MAG: 2-amino-4-hydroxy-6-hydroxymethyldihydropteridine diphosphokinase [Acidobacteriota bacterium]